MAAGGTSPAWSREAQARTPGRAGPVHRPVVAIWARPSSLHAMGKGLGFVPGRCSSGQLGASLIMAVTPPAVRPPAGRCPRPASTVSVSLLATRSVRPHRFARAAHWRQARAGHQIRIVEHRRRDQGWAVRNSHPRMLLLNGLNVPSQATVSPRSRPSAVYDMPNRLLQRRISGRLALNPREDRRIASCGPRAAGTGMRPGRHGQSGSGARTSAAPPGGACSAARRA